MAPVSPSFPRPQDEKTYEALTSEEKKAVVSAAIRYILLKGAVLTFPTPPPDPDLHPTPTSLVACGSAFRDRPLPTNSSGDVMI